MYTGTADENVPFRLTHLLMLLKKRHLNLTNGKHDVGKCVYLPQNLDLLRI